MIQKLEKPTLAEFIRLICHDWLNAMSGALSVIFSFIGIFYQNQFHLWEISAIAALLFMTYRVWASERKHIIALQNGLNSQPRIAIEKVECSDTGCELIVRNTGGNMINEGSIVIEDIEGSPYNNQSLPLALRTVNQTDRNASGSFKLRVDQFKKVPLLERNITTHPKLSTPIKIMFEKEIPTNELPDSREYVIHISAHSETNADKKKIKVFVGKDNKTFAEFS